MATNESDCRPTILARSRVDPIRAALTTEEEKPVAATKAHIPIKAPYRENIMDCFLVIFSKLLQIIVMLYPERAMIWTIPIAINKL
jgi:hypothetical protein